VRFADAGLSGVMCKHLEVFGLHKRYRELGQSQFGVKLMESTKKANLFDPKSQRKRLRNQSEWPFLSRLFSPIVHAPLQKQLKDARAWFSE
jgi:hypothetical protein